MSEIIKCQFNEIVVIEAQNKHSIIHTIDKGEFLSTIPMSRMLSKTQGTGLFLRVHRSFLVLADRIEGYKRDQVKVKGYNGTIKIGVTFHKQFMEFIDLKMIK